jgi:NADPH-dependent 2,4-dienoyl-CoA reductase/sulfur reductase-like enzyme
MPGEVVIIGAGPAGLAAGSRAAESGSAVTIVDDNIQPGGQIWRGGAAEAEPWLISGAPRVKARWILGARVFGAPRPGCVAVEYADGTARELAYSKLILATGARERFLPFPGWTLPNVMGAGGLQALAKSGFPIEGKRVVVAGSGPLLMAVASYLLEHGAAVRLIAEQASPSNLLRFGLMLGWYPRKAFQAARLRASLRAVPYRLGCWPVAAHGSEKLESVTLRLGGRSWTEPCDYLACGFGLVPNTELAALLGCRVDQSVTVDEYQRTTVDDIYCAGEGTGIGGLELSLVEGEIAGFAAAGRKDQARRRFTERAAHRRFAAALEQAFALRAELRALPQHDTLLCRCEDVTWERVDACKSWREAKLHTRCGMGPCQGRVCGAATEFLLGWKTESVRPPVFPVRIGNLAR